MAQYVCALPQGTIWRLAVASAVTAAIVWPASSARAGERWMLVFYRQIGNNENANNRTIENHLFREDGTKGAGVGATNRANSDFAIFGTTDANGWNRVNPLDPNNCSYDIQIYDPPRPTDETPDFYFQDPTQGKFYSYVTQWMYVSDDSVVTAHPTTPVYHYDLVDGINQVSGLDPDTCEAATFTEPPGVYSDEKDLTNWNAYQAQTFVVPAGINRIVSVQAFVTRQYGVHLQYIASIRQGGPTGPQIGPAVTSRDLVSGEFKEVLVSWALDDVPVIPGQTYALRLEAADGGGFNVWGTNPSNEPGLDNYPAGQLYNGSAPQGYRDMFAVVVGVEYDESVPTIERSPASFTRTVTEGENLPNDTFFVRNSGTGTLEYAVSDDRPWMWSVPNSGTSTGEWDTITLVYDTTSLAPGQYTGTITIADPDATNSPQYIQMNLTVEAPLLVRPQPGTLVFQDGRKYPDETLYAGTKDAHILQTHSLYNAGGNDVLEAARFDGGNSTNDRSVVIKFTDLDTSLEAGRYLDQAVLTLNYFASRNDPGGVAKTLYVHKLLHDWGEGTKTGIDGEWAGAGEVCWTKPYGATGGDNPNWNGTLDAQYADPVVLDSAALASGAYGPVSFDVTEAVRGHLASPSQNFGFVIREEAGSESTQNGTRQFHSREYTQIGSRPSLTLTFVDQAPPVNIESVQSRADHGGAGELGLGVNLTASTLPADSALVTTESREAGITKLLIDCDGEATLPNPPESLVESIVGVNNGDVTGRVVSVTAVGDVITINLSPLPDQDTYTITLASSVIAGDRDFMIRGLAGEVDNAGTSSQVVNALDLSGVRIHFGSDVTVGDNAKYDIVSDGAINALDLSECRIVFTHTAP